MALPQLAKSNTKNSNRAQTDRNDTF